MAQKDYAEILCQAVDEIVTKKLEGISFDKTINCTIIDDKKASEGQYKVTDGSAKFYAYSASTDYKENDAVYVTVPNGDFNNQKIIIGKQVTKNTSPFLFTTPFDTIVDVSTNLINDKNTEGYLRANDPIETQVLLWEKDFTENNQDIAGFTRLGLQGQFRSWLDSFKCISGNYGYKLILHCKEEVVKTEENNYDLAIKKLEELINEGKEYFDTDIKNYIEISCNIKTISWEDYYEEGYNYKIADILPILQSQRVELSYARYELFLSSTNDMYGNPYNFESYYQQEKVFNISAIKEIQKMELYFYQEPQSFIDKNEKQVPYNDDFGNPLLPNLFTKDAYICLGYDIASFDNDQANIYCLDSNTYSDHYLLEDNEKHIILRWIHKFEDGRIKTVADDSDLQYEIRWYRYKLGAPSADEYSGVYWERIQTLSESGIIKAKEELAIKIQEIDESNYSQVTKNILKKEALEQYEEKIQLYTSNQGFFFTLNPDVTKETEQIKAIILYNDKVIRSNILTFTNEKEVINEATSNFLAGLNIWCKDNTYGNYYIYDPGNKMLEQYDVKQARELNALFSTQANLMTSESEGSLLTEATSITWTFPTVSTMLTVYGIDYSVPYPDKDNSQFAVCAPQGMTAAQAIKETFDGTNLHTLTYEPGDGSTIVYDHIAKTIEITRYGDINNAEAIDASQLYFIKKDYIQSYANNVIQCSIIKNHTEYFTSKTFYFGQAGTTGTDVTLKIYIDPADKFALTKQEGGDTLHLRAMLFDSHNKEVDPNDRSNYADVKYEWSWFDYKYDYEETLAVQIQPFIGSYEEQVEKDAANQIIKNKKWFYDTEKAEYIFQDLTTYYSNSARNEIIISADDNLTMNHFLILQCTVKGWGDYDLTAYKPIAIRLGETYSYVDCANEIIYLTSGYPEYYKEKWKIHFENIDEDNDGYEDEDISGYWKIFNPHNEDTNYIGSFKENILNPIGIYTYDIHQYGAQYVSTSGSGKQEAIKILEKIDRRASFIDAETQQKINNLTGLTIYWLNFKNGEMIGGSHENGITATIKYITFDIDKLIAYINENAIDNAEVIVWTQPIICLTNNYPSGTLNKWTGKEIDINTEGGYILSPAIATGKKNSDNTFSGIMLGDWSHDKITEGENPFLTKQTGVYGFHHGMLSYALMEDGTAFFGKSGKGRIMLDGNESTISNYGYRLGNAGMMIDLDDAYIDMRDNTKSRVYISKDGTSFSPFFEIMGSNQELIHISNSGYYLQTDDYNGIDKGVLIDLANGHIDAYDFKIEASGAGGTLTIDSSDQYYPFNVNDKFKIAWDGGVIATWGNIGGFYISDHAIFGGVSNIDSSNVENILVDHAETYWGQSTCGASTYDFRLGNSLVYDGSFSTYGKLYLASNLYSIKRTSDAGTTILSKGDIAASAYFMFGINNVNDGADRLQIGSATSGMAGYDGISMYGNGGAIYLISTGSSVNDFGLKVGLDEIKIVGRGAATELNVSDIPADRQHGIYARFG